MIFIVTNILLLISLLLPTSSVLAKNKKKDQKKEIERDNGAICPDKRTDPPVNKRSDVYVNVPYKAGESAEYEVSYGGAVVGNAKIEVRSPAKTKLSNGKSYWMQNLHVDAKTGDWYKLIFVAHDTIDALVRPWDGAISRFYIEQDEGKMFGRRLQQKKWLDFAHEDCKVNERIQKEGKKEKSKEIDLAYGARDTLGVSFWLREQTYELGKKYRTLVYSSEKNWWLEAEPIEKEEIKTKAGTFKTTKLKLQTYVGQELQQKGDVNIWIAESLPQRPIVAIKAEISLGSIWIELQEFKPGS